ncbi:Ig-specific serine endopeptidase MIP [Mycoplasma sp. 'Moose RK']|uniref:Ig-specific serine endopeptidase MIP n=1 Tax=Mycoplasma sp. 'Moose RK' TaxID=2780095 RepID=UPI0018C2BC4C|nr:DUF31 family protein [Mycoplasma sp. 'Moose RK']MBG0730738.1 DUF31 family protein [Mycoplasma sp. 'Moose RK']
MKIRCFFPFLLIPFAIISCGNKVENAAETKISKKDSDHSHENQEQKPGTLTSSQELVFQKLEANLETLFSQSDQKSFEKFSEDSKKTIYELLSQETIDPIEKQQTTEKIENIFSAITKVAQRANFDLNKQKDVVKLSFGSLKDLFRKKEKKPKIEHPPQNPRPEDPKINDAINDSRPSGQNFSRFNNDGTRIILDQYENDFPQKEWNWYRLNSNFSANSLKFGEKSQIPEKPKEFPKISSEISAKLAEKAKKVNQPLYENAQFRTFSLPDFDQSGQITGIKFNNYQRGFATPAWWKASEDGDYTFGGPNRIGLPRRIVSEDYKNLIDNVVSLRIENLIVNDSRQKFNNNYAVVSSRVYGTAAILDYKIPDDPQKYPLKWFFLTNAHVANNLQIANDTSSDKIAGRDFSNYNTKDLRLNTKSIMLTKLKKQIPLNSVLPTSRGGNDSENYVSVKIDIKETEGNLYNTGREIVEPDSIGKDSDYGHVDRKTPTKPMNVRTIVIGSDMFNTKFSTYSKQPEFKDFGDLLDFAVIEINFSDEASAKKITGDFYEKMKSSNLKVVNLNPLQKNQYEKIEKTPFYVLGYGGTAGDPTVSTVDSNADFELRNDSVSPWTNKNFRLFSSTNPTDPLINGGSEFAWSRSFRSFVNLPGLSDFLISAPVFENEYAKLHYFDQSSNERKTKKYLNAGLGTIIDNFTATNGVSGSPVFLKNGEIYSLVYASNSTASASLTLNLRSYGQDYSGYYGGYNLPKYDLIYGDSSSTATQKKSYWAALSSLYKSASNFKTSLFPDGIDKQKNVFN